MSTAFIFVLLAPLLYAIANLVDKMQLHGKSEDSEPLSLMALGSVIGFIFMIPMGLFIYFTGRSLGETHQIIGILLNELTYNVAIFIYMWMLKREETSNVVPWFQSVPMFGLVGAWLILGEELSVSNITAIALVMVGGFVLSYHSSGFKFKLFVIMLVSSAFFALYDVIFANFGRDIDQYSAIFLSIVGKTLWSLPILIGKKERAGFVTGLKTRLKFQTVGELTNLFADVSLQICLLHFPVGLVQGACCTQPFFILIGAIVITKYCVWKKKKDEKNNKDEDKSYPKWLESVIEDISAVAVKRKTIGITLLVIGGILMS